METTTETIQYDDFAKVDLRVGTVVECKPHPKGTKLFVLQVELANGERRQICAGIRKFYEPDQLIGKQIIIVANLAPRELLGEMSHGMLLAAGDPVTGKAVFLSPSETVPAGVKVS